MAESAKRELADAPPEHKPYVPDEARIPEFTWPSVLVGTVLGIIFGASSLYLLLKVGMTVSASVPIAVLSITLFRAFSKGFGFRRATILENNIVQTVGSAGESLAFGVGVTMPALLLLGFEMHWVRVMTVAVLGGLLGVLMMIPLRRAFIVKQHGKLRYPEGTACAEVLEAGEKGGASAKMVFVGFGIAFVYKFLMQAFQLWPEEPSAPLYRGKAGLRGAELSGDLAPEMMGVGYLIGPRIACLMMAGAVISFFVIGPLIVTFGEGLTKPVPPAESVVEDGKDKGLIANMSPRDLYNKYLRIIGAGAVAAGGIISMCRALPLIFGSIFAGLRDLRSGAGGGAARTERDLPMWIVVVGSLGLVIALAAVPQLGLGFTVQGIVGSLMILVFGFLFVTVSSRLTGEVGSSSNPISGMTIATLLLVCIIFFVMDKRDVPAMLTSLSIAAVVCIASSNGGTTSQDLKTGYLVGATPKYQQLGILIGALTSAVVIGLTMMALNAGGTHYTTKGVQNLPAGTTIAIPKDAERQKAGQPYEGKDNNEYAAVFVRKGAYPEVPEGWYLVDDQGHPKYWIDTPINRQYEKMDVSGDEEKAAPEKFHAPQPALFAMIIRGILGGDLEWGLIIIGALVAVAMELLGVSSLAVAVGMYLGLGTATPIFIGGMLRWLTDKLRGGTGSDVETETSPGVLLSSGYIAGGTLCGLLLGFVTIGVNTDFLGMSKLKLDFISTKITKLIGAPWEENEYAKIISVAMFVIIGLIMLVIGMRKSDVGPTLPQQDTGELVHPPIDM